jgi:hypothetical protein
MISTEYLQFKGQRAVGKVQTEAERLAAAEIVLQK